MSSGFSILGEYGLTTSPNQACQPGEEKGGSAVGREAAGGVPPLPCLNSNNCTEGKSFLTSAAKRTAYILKLSVEKMVKKHGLERVGFLTLTFADHVLDPKEASRRFHSLKTHVLNARYSDWLWVYERQKSGRIHYHLLVAMQDDIRTGVDFIEFEKGNYRSANNVLRKEWAFWRKTAVDYRFGRTELLPIKSTAEGIGRYVGKYIQKHLEAREDRDKGVRLVGASKGAMAGSVKFAWASPAAWLWRHKLEVFAKRFGLDNLEMLKVKFGPSWAHKFQNYIACIDLLDETGSFTYPDKTTAEKDGHWFDDDEELENFKGPITIRRISQKTKFKIEPEFEQSDIACHLDGIPASELPLDRWIDLVDDIEKSKQLFADLVDKIPPPYYDPKGSGLKHFLPGESEI